MKKYLNDIYLAIEKIYIHIKNINSIFEYENNITVKSAVERELEIIGEAMNRLINIAPEVEITSPRKIISLRNRIIHGYDRIDDYAIWDIVINNIPQLKEEVKILLEKDDK